MKRKNTKLLAKLQSTVLSVKYKNKDTLKSMEKEYIAKGGMQPHNLNTTYKELQKKLELATKVLHIWSHFKFLCLFVFEQVLDNTFKPQTMQSHIQNRDINKSFNSGPFTIPTEVVLLHTYTGKYTPACKHEPNRRLETIQILFQITELLPHK